MTKQEAVEILNSMKYPYKAKRGVIISDVNKENDALEMAIGALNREIDEEYDLELEDYVMLG